MKRKIYILALKPFFDFVLSLSLIILLSPILIIVAFIIFLIDGPPIIFKQERVGQKRKSFLIYKFKTMRTSSGPFLTFDNDPRITKLGRFLRRFKIDELPQLLNIATGKMSFIGYRPEVPILAKERYKISSEVFELKPGITGLSSIEFIDEGKLLPRTKVYDHYLKFILPQKIAKDTEYSQKISLLLDLSTIYRTILVLFKTVLK